MGFMFNTEIINPDNCRILDDIEYILNNLTEENKENNEILVKIRRMMRKHEEMLKSGADGNIDKVWAGYKKIYEQSKICVDSFPLGNGPVPCASLIIIYQLSKENCECAKAKMSETFK